jgi:DNA polymerase-3 subunit gamma/tau
VGQEHVVRTLSHAVERDQIHHAYLFVGSRGTGKTSMAKILAACLNCVNGPTVSPCGVCDSCVSIASATSLDVIEMDAASNNSVDDIRDLREKVGYAPVSGRHKVYILDEAHMLSTQAWNAFLKTLEEPPPRTVFVLATTEAQKVLPTVVDRCHRFDFGRPSAEQVATVIRRVAATESIQIGEGATALIARHATGSFRDALGTLEQLVTYAGDDAIKPEDVLAVLGVADAEQLFGAVDAIVARDGAAALRAAAQLASSGRDPGQVLRDLEVHGRELLTVQILGEVPAELRVTPDRDQRLIEQAATLDQTDAVRLLELVSAALEATANGAQPRIQLELVLVKAAAPQTDASMSALFARLERLEKGLAEGLVRPAVSSAASKPAQGASFDATDETTVPSPAAPAAELAASGSEAAPAPAPAAAPAPAPAPAPVAEPAPAAAPAPDFADAADGDYGWGPADDYENAQELEQEPAAAEIAPPAPTTLPSAPATEPAGSLVADEFSEAAIDLAASENSQAPDSATTLQPGTVADMVRAWPAVIELVRGGNAMVAAVLEGAKPTAVSERELVLTFPAEASFYKRKAEQDDYRRAAAEAVRNVTGVALALRFELSEPRDETSEPEAEAEVAPMSDDELVRKFVEEFGAEEILQDDQERES